MKQSKIKYFIAPIRFIGEFSLSSMRPWLKELRKISTNRRSFVLDLRMIEVWEPAALMWFSLGVKKMLDDDFEIHLLLPDTSIRLEREYGHATSAKAQSSGDFLRSWRYDVILRRMGGIERILLPEQWDYFETNRKINGSDYVCKNWSDRDDRFFNLLFPFYDFTVLEIVKDLNAERARDGAEDAYEYRISHAKTSGRTKDLYAAAKFGAFTQLFGMPEADSCTFVSRVIAEALEGVERRNGATFGMMTFEKPRTSNKLTFVLMDDGESIYTSMLSHMRKGWKQAAEDGKRNISLVANVLDIATGSETSAIPDGELTGLYYMKRQTLRSFGGTLAILTAGVSCTFTGDDEEASPSSQRWDHWWEGNLLLIEIPIDAGEKHEHD